MADPALMTSHTSASTNKGYPSPTHSNVFACSDHTNMASSLDPYVSNTLYTSGWCITPHHTHSLTYLTPSITRSLPHSLSHSVSLLINYVCSSVYRYCVLNAIIHALSVRGKLRRWCASYFGSTSKCPQLSQPCQCDVLAPQIFIISSHTCCGLHFSLDCTRRTARRDLWRSSERPSPASMLMCRERFVSKCRS